MQTILVVDGDGQIRTLLGYLLGKEGFEVLGAADGDEAIELALAHEPVLFIVDLVLCHADGLELCRTLRRNGNFRRTPILTLTALDEMTNKYAAFEAGANSFMLKPFDPLELVFRVRSLLLLSGATTAPGAPFLESERVQLHPSRYVATVDGLDIELTKLETRILEYLMQHRAEVVSAERLTAEVLERGRDGVTRTVDAAQAHIRHLRVKLEKNPKRPTIVVTIGKNGYRFSG